MKFSRLPFIKPANQSAHKVQRLVLHPAAVAVFLFVTTFFFLFYAENRYSTYPTRDQFLFNYGWGLIYFWCFYFYMGKPVQFLVTHNFPMVWCWSIYFICISTIEAIFVTFIIKEHSGFIALLWHVLSTMTVIVPAILINGFYFEKQIRNFLSDEPEKVPYWQRYNSELIALYEHLPKHVRGKILRIEAMNQYIQVVTDNGTAELRMSLQAATDLLPNGLGLRVHRSVWLNSDEINALIYVDGNPRVVLHSGEKFPVSRNKVEAVKRQIA